MGRVLVAFFLALLAGCSGSPARVGASSSSPPSPRPKLVVLIVIDQLPTWVFERDRALFTGGFARLLREGGYVRAGELPYANPFTAPGHATIATGAPPSVHGILGNRWYRRAEGRDQNAEFDPEATVFAIGPSNGGELSPEDASSARALRVEGIADALRRATGGRGRSAAIALKPRAAAFVAGRRPDLAIWYEAAAGGMTTSRAYADQPPRWLRDHAKTSPASRFFDAVWEPRDAELLARTTGLPDAAPGEGSVHGLDATFPHSLAGSDAPARALLHTPYGDELVFDAAVAAIEAMGLGADDVPDLLAVSFNARDYAGHLWGPDSWEALDLMLRLDAKLDALFDDLDRRLGRDRWAVVLTSDHGASPIVERSTMQGARRIRTEEIGRAAGAALARTLGEGTWIARVAASNIYLKPAFAELPAARRDEALSAAALAVAELAGIAAAGRSDQIAGNCDQRSGLERAICFSVVSGESGELYVVPVAGSLISDYVSGTHHDAPFDDNRLVPILVMAPGLAAQTGTGSVLQVAPTLAALLRVPPPSAATAAPLFGLGSR